MSIPLTLRRQASDLCALVKGLPDNYAPLSDKHLEQLSSFYVALREGLECFPGLYGVIEGALAGRQEEPFSAIYAELARRVPERADGGEKAVLVHALCRQATCAPCGGYGERGSRDRVERLVFDTLDQCALGADSRRCGYPALTLALDTFSLLGAFEAEEEECLESALARWESEREEGGWADVPACEKMQRLRVITAYRGLRGNGTEASARLLDEFVPSALGGADADTLLACREALRNVFCYHTVRTPYFRQLERAQEALPAGLAADILRALLLVDRMERGMADELLRHA